MELFLILYFIVGTAGFLLMYYFRKVRQRPAVIPVWAIVLYYVIAIMLAVITYIKDKDQQPVIDPFMDDPYMQKAPYKQGQFKIPNN